MVEILAQWLRRLRLLLRAGPLPMNVRPHPGTSSWTFRLRLRLSDRNRLKLCGTTYRIQGTQGRATVDVSPWPDPLKPIEDSEWIVFKGTSGSEDEARREGAILIDQLRRAFARLRVTAELGKAPRGGFTAYGRKLIADATGRTILDDVHGLMVYRTDDNPQFLSLGTPRMFVTQSEWRVEQTLTAAFGQPLSTEEQIAWDLFSGSAFEYSANARLLLLVMAVETLLTPPGRSPSALALVERLIATTEGEATLSRRERDSLLGSLRWLRKESITQSGIMLMDRRLNGRTYGGRTAIDIWQDAYNTRSTLAHGRQAPQDVVEGLGGHMFEIVGDLLSGSLLTFEPNAPQQTTDCGTPQFGSSLPMKPGRKRRDY